MDGDSDDDDDDDGRDELRWLGWEINVKKNYLDPIGEMKQEVYSKGKLMHVEMSDLWFLKRMIDEGGREMVTMDKERVLQGNWISNYGLRR